MSTYIYFIVVAISILLIVWYILLPTIRLRYFNKYFDLHIVENYNLDDLFPIKIQGNIIPKVNFLDIPYGDLDINIFTRTIRGNISNNIASMELIRPKDRKQSIYLIKYHYIKTVTPYIDETIKNKKEYIDLINISNKHKQGMEKIACQTCKHRVQCQISFTECNYEREVPDKILEKGLVVNTSKNYEADVLKN